jgi:hypothetical protein
MSVAASAQAVGYWNVPGNLAQWWGYGWGGGHHACFVLGPVTHHGAFMHHHKRLPYAPQPVYDCYDGCCYNYDFRQPAPSTTPDVLPLPEPAVAPDTAFPAPVEP